MRDIFDWPSFTSDFSAAALSHGFTSEILHETEDGPLVAWERPGHGPRVYLSAGIHGDEPAGPLALLEMMERDAFPENFHWMICPALNPGGLAIHSRENRAGIDLNRDYLRKSTLEVAAHASWLDRHPVPDAFVSFHEDWESAGFYFYEINCGDDSPARSRAILNAVSPVFAHEQGVEIDGHAVREPGWIFHCAEADLPDSWPEAIWLAKKGCPLSFTFETPSQAHLPDRVHAHIAGFQEMLRHLS